MKNIIFIVQQISQPRCIKRIKNFIDAGYKVRVFGFNNGLYQENLDLVDFKIEEQRQINKKANPFIKVLHYFKFIRYVLQKINKKDTVYAFGFEVGSIVSMLHSGNYIYEEADVSAARVKNSFIRAFLIYLDRLIIQRSKLTVFTSKGFQDYLFPREKPYSKKTMFLLNKLDSSFRNKEREQKKQLDISSIDFGFIGLIRYPNTILRFAKLVGENFPQHRFHFWGDVEGNILEIEDWSQFSNIYFYGSFANPTDLEDIYSNIDINIACYDPNSGNVNIAEPNKLYESIFFGKPLIVTENTYLHQRIQSLEVGFGINALSDEAIISFIQNLTLENISACQMNCYKVRIDELVNNPESDMEQFNELIK